MPRAAANVVQPEDRLNTGTFTDRIFGDRFRPLQVLKQSQHTVSLKGVDLSTNEPVVIKLVDGKTVGPGAQMRLEHETRVMREINGPPCSGFTHSGQQNALLFLVRPYCSGVTLEQRLAEKPLDVREAVTLGSCLMDALREAHSRRVLHLDIKPANIVVDNQAPLTRATLIDFGFFRNAQLDADAVSAARYMSPEQAGLLDQEVDESADLYAAGVVLFECLAGRSLFQATTVGEVLRQHMTSPAPELRALGLSVPRSLDEVIQRLLRKDPRDRYQSAEAVAADLAVIAEGLQRGESDPSVVVGLHDRRRTLTEPAFVGRSRELATLHAQLQRSRRGQNSLVLLEAESGGGKSRLLREFMIRCAQEGTWVLRGQGLDQAAQRPFQLLAGIAAGLSVDSRLDPHLADRVRDALGDQLAAVCASLPELADTFGATADDIGPETFAEARSLQALSVLLDALGEAGRPVVLLLDDCQWGDQLSLKVLRHWQRRCEAESEVEKGGVLLVAAFRSEEVQVGHELRNLRPTAHLTLPEFQTSDVQQLVESMAGPLPDEAVQLIEGLAAGNPFMASAALRGLVESAALVAVDEGWQVEPLAMSDVQSSRHAAAFLAQRIELLPEPSIRLLSVGAVLGKEFDLFAAASLADQASEEAIAALDVARHRHIVWARMQDSQCEFMHDKLRETMLARLPEKERRDLHLRAALDLEAHNPERVFELAYHFDASGDSERALPYALKAAERARMQHALQLAERQYRIALRGAPDDQAVRYQIAEGLGDVLMLLGRYEEAARQTESARSLAVGDIAKAQVEGKLAELAFKQGDMKPAIEANERALRLLGNNVPQWSASFFLCLLREAIVQAFHTLMPKLFLARKSLDGVEKELLTVRLYNRLTYAYWFGRGKIPCLWAHLRAMNRAELYPPTLELAQTYSIHGPAMSLLALFSRGIAYSQKAFNICESLGDLWGQGLALHFNGLVHFVASRFEQCIEKCSEAVRLLERTGDVWEVNIASYHIANSFYRLGDLKSAAVEARRIHKSGLELGDVQASGICFDVWVRASGGQVNPEALRIELQRKRADVQVSAQVQLAEGARLFWQDRAEEAANVFDAARQYAAGHGVENAWTHPLRPWLASALRRQVERTSSLEPERRTALLKRASKVATKAVRIARKFQNDLPHALREAGLISAMKGSIRHSRRYLDESLDVAQRQGARFEHAQTLLARGRVGLLRGWSRAEEEVAEARQALIEMGADFALDERPTQTAPTEQVTLSLADRFDTVLESGRQIASALTRKSIYAAVWDASLKLLRGEECVVLQVNPECDEEATPVSGEITGKSCPAMIRRALSAGRAVTYTEGASEDASESLLLSGVRSALCVPILVRGRPEACIFLTHRDVSGLFDVDEQRLAEFIATIAGAALENADGFAQLQQLTETLEQRVKDRTAALEASNIELQQFAYVASHDLQTPLRSVAAFAQFLQKDYQGKLGEQADDYIRRMVGSVTRMQTMINDLLAYSHIDSRAAPFQQVDLRRVCDDVVALLRSSIEDVGGEVTYNELPTVTGDRSQFSQLLQNLIGNGIKYHGTHPPRVHLSAESGDGAWVIAVRDNGIGIDPKFHEQIFEIFRRLHTEQEYPGTGIGLAVCHRIVHRHGGEIRVESEPGKGSTFYFSIPVRSREKA